MKINQLPTNAQRRIRRRGRGIAAGQGKTAGRGTKGQKSRSGGGVRPFFEGGQTPLVRRLPKLAGFKSHRLAATVVYTGQLDALATKIIDNHLLVEKGLIKDAYTIVKVVKKGEVTKACQIHLQRISKGALEAVRQAGGDFQKTARLKRPSKEAQAGLQSQKDQAEK